MNAVTTGRWLSMQENRITNSVVRITNRMFEVGKHGVGCSSNRREAHVEL